MRLFVPLNSSETDALIRLAAAERRRPQDQAALLLARSLALSAVDEVSHDALARVPAPLRRGDPDGEDPPLESGTR